MRVFNTHKTPFIPHKKQPYFQYLFIISLSFLLFSQLNAQSSGFGEARYLGSNSLSGALAVESGDFNGDGQIDLLAYSEWEVKWLENLGGGSFSEAELLFDLNSPPLSLVTGDVDNDGYTDIVTIQEANPEELIVLFGTGSGNFNPPDYYSLQTRGAGAKYLRVATLQIREIPDQPAIVYLRYGRGSYDFPDKFIREITFSTNRELTEYEALEGVEATDLLDFYDFRVTDFNGDQIPDFLVYPYTANETEINLIIGQSEASPKIIVIETSTEEIVYRETSDLLMIDVNQDGYQDIVQSNETVVTTDPNEELVYGYVHWFKNEGDSAFSKATRIDSLPRGFTDLYLYDVDQDGLDDLIAKPHPGNRYFDAERGHSVKIFWYKNLGYNGYGETQELSKYYNEIRFADVDSDGIEDMLGFYKSGLNWYKNSGSGIDAKQLIIQSDIYFGNSGQIKSDDVNNDGLEDIITGTEEGLYWFENRNNLSFSEAQSIDPNLANFQQLEMADVDNDGWTDIITLTSRLYYDQNEKRNVMNLKIHYYDNSRDGTFSKTTLIEAPYELRNSFPNISMGDYDADGDSDLSVRWENELYWMENESGVFSEKIQLIEAFDSSINWTNLNASFSLDDKPGDEIISSYTVQQRPFPARIVFHSFSEDSAKFFKLWETDIEPARQQEYIQVGGYDLNGSPEIIFASINESDMTREDIVISMLSKDGENPEWKRKVLFEQQNSFGFSGIFIKDLNNDGKFDWVNTTNRYQRRTNGSTPTTYEGGTVEWYEQMDNSTFISHAAIDSLKKGATSVLAAELNNDDFPEIVAGIASEGRIAIYEGFEKTPTVSTEIKEDIPSEIWVHQNYPNPFNPTTTISYSLPEAGFVELKVYNLLGKLVQTLVYEQKTAGEYQVQFNASSLSSGVYFYQLKAKNTVINKKMILVK